MAVAPNGSSWFVLSNISVVLVTLYLFELVRYISRRSKKSLLDLQTPQTLKLIEMLTQNHEKYTSCENSPMVRDDKKN